MLKLVTKCEKKILWGGREKKNKTALGRPRCRGKPRNALEKGSIGKEMEDCKDRKGPSGAGGSDGQMEKKGNKRRKRKGKI